MNCGTRKGYDQHKAANTPPCKWCIKAVTDPAPPVKRKPRPKKKPTAHKPRILTPRTIIHGTPHGYQIHRELGEDCQECRQAASNTATPRRGTSERRRSV